jgi:oligopeptide/dipeptide ABC transporter ATP-binding protein
VETIINVSRLVKRFPVPNSKKQVWAINDVSFTVNKGETLGLVGESGSGKTTIGRCLLRLAEPTSGQLLFDGKDITKIKEKELRQLRSRMQIVFQEPYDSMNPRKTIGDTIREPLMASKMSTSEQMERVVELMSQVFLDRQDISKYPHELSAGQLQRAGVARAIATNADLIVLDEPTSLLDPSVRADIIDLLVTLQKRTGVSYLFISHDLTSVQYISHRVAVIYLGKIVEMGITRQIFENPLHPYSKALLSAVLFPDPNRKRVSYSLRGEIPSPIDLPSGCFLHSRCPMAIGACSRITPQLVDVGDGHSVSCIRVAPLPGQIVEPGQLVTLQAA